jgi:hypothetical protein
MPKRTNDRDSASPDYLKCSAVKMKNTSVENHAYRQCVGSESIMDQDRSARKSYFKDFFKALGAEDRVVAMRISDHRMLTDLVNDDDQSALQKFSRDDSQAKLLIIDSTEAVDKVLKSSSLRYRSIAVKELKKADAIYLDYSDYNTPSLIRDVRTEIKNVLRQISDYPRCVGVVYYCTSTSTDDLDSLKDFTDVMDDPTSATMVFSTANSHCLSYQLFEQKDFDDCLSDEQSDTEIVDESDDE